MSLTLYLHPLSSFCHKVLIALYENGIPFSSHSVDLGDPAKREEFTKISPFGQFPLLRDEARGRTIPQSTVIIEYLQQHYPGPVKLIPADPELALQVRSADRFYDLHLHVPMQKAATDKLRPADRHDSLGVEQAWGEMRTALRVANSELATRRWAAGEHFSMADCAAGPPLFFTNRMMPLADEFPYVDAYLDRLMARPSYARALAEAEPYLHMFPGNRV